MLRNERVRQREIKSQKVRNSESEAIIEKASVCRRVVPITYRKINV